MFCLFLDAPFAACRTFTAGWYRPTAGFLTPSAAYGLLLNVAGIESRLREEDGAHDGKTPASLMRLGLPSLRLAVGAPPNGRRDPYPLVQTIYQQLHNYPVGTSGQERADSAKGNKYNITPVRRELLSGLQALICIDGNPELEARLRRGLRGEFNDKRYGVPFLGDNQFLIDRLAERSLPQPAHWYERINEASAPRPRTTRLTILIDRGDLSRTSSALYAPTEAAEAQIPSAAWTIIEPPGSEPLPR
jgi:CRISPR-associated protein Cas5t